MQKTLLQWKVFYRNAWNTNSVSWQDWNSTQVSEPDRALVASTHPPWATSTEWAPEKGKPGPLSMPHLQQFLISPFWDLGELCAASGAQPLQAQGLCPGLCCQILPQDLCQAKQLLRQECAAALLCAQFSPTDTIQYFRLSGFFCGAACAGGTGLCDIQNDFDPNMDIKLKKFL